MFIKMHLGVTGSSCRCGDSFESDGMATDQDLGVSVSQCFYYNYIKAAIMNERFFLNLLSILFPRMP